MRACLFALPVMLLACEDGGGSPASPPAPNFAPDSATGETRAGSANAKLRSGPTVPVVLPSGFSLYPGAAVVRNTQVEQGGGRRVLVEFETPDPVCSVIAFHRAQAEAAGVSLALDLGGTDAASIAGRTNAGDEFALTARRTGRLTVAQLAVSTSAGS